MRFVCFGYIDDTRWEGLSEEERTRLMNECFAYDDELRQGGHFAGGIALEGGRSAVTLRYRENSLNVTDGPFIESKEQIGGILLLEARDLSHAVQLMSKHPGVKMGPFEIRPADAQTNQLIAERDAKVAG